MLILGAAVCGFFLDLLLGDPRWLPHPIRAIGALISVSIAPCDRESFLEMTRQCPQVCQCFHVTGSHSFIAKVSCHNMQDLEQLITQFQQMGPTSTQIILSTPVERSPLFEELPQECNESPC